MSNDRDSKSEESISVTSISKDNSDLLEEKQVVGRKIWRIFPYVLKYWQRALGGLLANMGARVFDLVPFIAIGMAADYYNPDNPQFTNHTIESSVTIESIPDLGPAALPTIAVRAFGVCTVEPYALKKEIPHIVQNSTRNRQSLASTIQNIANLLVKAAQKHGIRLNR